MAASDDTRVTESGIPIERVYDADAVADLDLSERLGEPGSYPFTRGVHTDMYRRRPWTMRRRKPRRACPGAGCSLSARWCLPPC